MATFIRTAAARPHLVGIWLNLDNVTFVEQVVKAQDLTKESHFSIVHFTSGGALEVWDSFTKLEVPMRQELDKSNERQSGVDGEQ